MKKHDESNIAKKFFNADMTPEEEKAYFDGESSYAEDELLSDYKSIMGNLKETELPDQDFDQKMIELLSSDSGSVKKVRVLPRIITIAASILILVAVWYTVDGNKQPAHGTITDPVAAFAHTKSALAIVSDKLNKGIKPASSTIKKVDKGITNTKSIKKAGETIKNIKNFNKLNKTEDLLKSMTKVTVKAG